MPCTQCNTGSVERTEAGSAASIPIDVLLLLIRLLDLGLVHAWLQCTSNALCVFRSAAAAGKTA